MRNEKGQFVKGQHYSFETEFQRGIIPVNKGKHHTEEAKKKMSEARMGKTPWNKGKKGYLKPDALEKMRESNRKRVGSKNGMWKGDDVGYGGLHKWVARQLGRPTYCANDLTHKSPLYFWANVSGEYKRDITDWHSLCPSCNKTDGINKAERFKEGSIQA